MEWNSAHSSNAALSLLLIFCALGFSELFSNASEKVTVMILNAERATGQVLQLQELLGRTHRTCTIVQHGFVFTYYVI